MLSFHERFLILCTRHFWWNLHAERHRIRDRLVCDGGGAFVDAAALAKADALRNQKERVAAKCVTPAALFCLDLERLGLPDEDPPFGSDDHSSTLHLKRIAGAVFVFDAPQLHVVVDHEKPTREDCEQPPHPELPHVSRNEDILRADTR